VNLTFITILDKSVNWILTCENPLQVIARK